ncbi:unnamed protein product, partial [Closterium sp. Naga37s-1]
QPTKGRAQQGGMRVGEMERDCLVAHGAGSMHLPTLTASHPSLSRHFHYAPIVTDDHPPAHQGQGTAAGGDEGGGDGEGLPGGARGREHMTTRQPTKGRAQQGGMRVGEMERDCLVAHGAAHSLSERLSLLSDATAVAVCSACRLIASAAGGPGGGAPGGGGGGGSGFDGYAVAGAAGATADAGGFGSFGGEGSDCPGPACQLCGSSTNTTEVCMPYALKLLFDEMRAMGISGHGDLSAFAAIPLIAAAVLESSIPSFR